AGQQRRPEHHQDAEARVDADEGNHMIQQDRRTRQRAAEEVYVRRQRQQASGEYHGQAEDDRKPRAEEQDREQPEQHDAVSQHLGLLDAIASMQVLCLELADGLRNQWVDRPGHQVLPWPYRIDVDVSKRARKQGGGRRQRPARPGAVGQQYGRWEERQEARQRGQRAGGVGADPARKRRIPGARKDQADDEEGGGKKHQDERELVVG